MSMGSEGSGQKSVRGHFSRPYNPRERIRFELGVMDGEESFSRFFKSAEEFVNILRRAQIYVRRELIYSKKGKENAINQIMVQKLLQIWYGPTWMIVVRNPENLGQVMTRQIAYKPYTLPNNMEAIKLPALKSLNPLDQIKSEKFLLRMREPVKINQALGGMEFRQVVLQGKWYHDYKFNRKPMFNSQADIEQNSGITMTVGRRWYFATVNFLRQPFEDLKAELDADFQELLDDDLKKGLNDNKDEELIPPEFNELN